MRENRALEAANLELRGQVEDVRAENLEVSEKIVKLDADGRSTKVSGSRIQVQGLYYSSWILAFEVSADFLSTLKAFWRFNESHITAVGV